MADQASDARHVVWVDTDAISTRREFYGELLGWSFTGGDDPNAGTPPPRSAAARWPAAGFRRRQNPPVWTVYLGADNADDIARKAKDAGSTVMIPPMDVMEHGRMAMLIDPTGAAFGIWQPKVHRGDEIVDEPGAMTWHEVYTRDLAKAREFYARVFGLEAKRLDSPSMEYWSLHKGPKTVGGVMQMTAAMPKEMPSHWNTYFAVADADASAKKVIALGGKVMAPPFDTPYGRMSAVFDPFGAAFCIIKLAANRPTS
jgi:predicted enzyme related to lactoylglutathione lyase